MSARKRGKTVGMRGKSYRAPHCSVHLTAKHMLRDPQGNWFCAECADDKLKETIESTRRRNRLAGVSPLIELPAGVIDPRIERASFRDILPNRAARRAARRMT